MTKTDDKTVARWRSERLGREVTLVRWGHFGQPVLLFPTAGGDAEEVERMWLIKALRPLINFTIAAKRAPFLTGLVRCTRIPSSR